MLKIVLVALNARFSHSSLALRCLKAYVEEQGQALACEIVLREFNINQTVSDIVGQLYTENAACLLFSTYIWNYELSRLILRRLRSLSPQLILGMGGPEASYNSCAELNDLDYLDIILQGEGEVALLSLLQTMVQVQKLATTKTLRELLLSSSLTQLRNIRLRSPAGDWHSSPLAAPLDLNTLPFPYKDGLATLANRTVYYESSRGCPFKCSYCLSANEAAPRYRALELVFAELDYFISEATVLVKFIDRSFNSKPQRARQIWQHLINKAWQQLSQGIAMTHWHFEIEARLLTEADFQLLATAPEGLFQFEIGIQSFNPAVLRGIRRSPDTAPIVHSLERLKQAGKIHCHIDLIFGLPGEDWSSCQASFNQAVATSADLVQLGFLKVLKGTPLQQELLDSSYIWTAEPPYEVLQSDALSYNEIWALKKLEKVFDRVSNSGLYPESLSYMQSAFPHPFALFSALSAYYEQEGLLFRPSSPENTELALLAFASQISGLEENILAQKLASDKAVHSAKQREAQIYKRRQLAKAKWGKSPT